MAGRKRILVVGGGISGLGAAWALNRHPDRFEFELWEKNERVGGNAVTAEMPQSDGTTIPFDISVTAYIPTAYNHYVLMLKRYGIQSLPTRFSYSVHYDGDVYAHDFDSPFKREVQDEIDRFQALLRRMKKLTVLSETTSRLKAAMNPLNY